MELRLRLDVNKIRATGDRPLVMVALTTTEGGSPDWSLGAHTLTEPHLSLVPRCIFNSLLEQLLL